ncbi:MAG: hypothetical protein OEL79_10550 [Chromatiales bacterium]|nr:hypothetical protein [Chromatiales bacterium]
MITKILFTALIILAALVFMRHKSSQIRRQELQREAQQKGKNRTAMFVAIAFVSLTLATSAGLYYSHWQEAHRIFTVQIINTLNGNQQLFHVYQGDINGRRFRTIDGRQINLSDSERMEVQEHNIDSNEYQSR